MLVSTVWGSATDDGTSNSASTRLDGAPTDSGFSPSPSLSLTPLYSGSDSSQLAAPPFQTRTKLLLAYSVAVLTQSYFWKVKINVTESALAVVTTTIRFSDSIAVRFDFNSTAVRLRIKNPCGQSEVTRAADPLSAVTLIYLFTYLFLSAAVHNRQVYGHSRNAIELQLNRRSNRSCNHRIYRCDLLHNSR